MLREIGPGENGFSNSAHNIPFSDFGNHLKKIVDMSNGIGLPQGYVPDTTYWLFVGDGHLSGQVNRQIEAAGLDQRIRLTGLVPPERVADLLHASDILVHCSLREGLARALPQAMLCGKPVVCYDLDGAPEVVIDDKTGYLVPPDDIDALVEAQEKLIADQDLRRRLGQTGKDFCSKEFVSQLMVDRVERVYQSLL